jgi:hypothetical protein
MQAVLSAADTLHIEILIPDVVYEEVCGGFRRELKERLANYQNALDKLTELNDDDIPRPPSSLQVVRHSAFHYDTFLRMRLMTPPFRTLPMPEISHNEVVKAAARKRKPFGGKNDGYGDFLIWQTIIEEVEANIHELPVYFISDNRNDFAANPKGDRLRLHGDFLDDLKSKGLPEDAVTYLPSIEDFRKQVINSRLDYLGELARSIVQHRFENPQLYETIPQAVEIWLDQHAANTYPQSMGLPSEVLSVHGAAPEVVDSITHADARLLPNNELVIDVVAVVNCLFDVEVEPISGLGERFDDRYDDYRRRASHYGAIEEDVTFIITSFVGPAPDYEIKRSDAILLAQPEQ